MHGSASRRDERRKGSIQRIQKMIASDRIGAREAAASPRLLETVEEHKARIARDKAYYEALEAKHKQMLENTIANMGKGSAAMRVRKSKDKSN